MCKNLTKPVTEAENRQKMNTRPRLCNVLNVKQKKMNAERWQIIYSYIQQPDYYV